MAIEPDVPAKTTARVARLPNDAEPLRAWLATHPTDRDGPTGGPRSNRTDNASAKMATDKDVIHGYTAVAAVDAKPTRAPAAMRISPRSRRWKCRR